MRFVSTFVVALAVLGGAVAIDAATVSGSFTYDGEEVIDVFGLPLTAVVQAHVFADGSVYTGTVDVDSGSYMVTGLPVGDGAVILEIDRSDPPDGSAEEPGDLESIHGYYTVAADDDDIDMDLQMRSMLHATSPVDTAGVLEGSASQCPYGPLVDDVFTLTWDPVPRATAYNVQVLRFRCDGTFTGDWIEATTTSVEVDVGTAGEDYVKIQLFVPGHTATDLAAWPYIQYQDGWANGFRVHAGGSPQPVRGTHAADSYFIPAVANAAGAQGTYWTTDLTVLNLSGSPRTVEAYYTPRGSDGTSDYLGAALELGPWPGTTWENVLGTVFGATGAGSLEIRGGDIVIASRTATPGDGGGSYGQGIPVVAPYHLLRIDHEPVEWASGVERSPSRRTNLGLCEVWGEPAEIVVSLWHQDGSAAGTRTVSLPPYGNTQINDLPHAIGGLDEMASGMVSLEITGGAGRVGAYLSIVDNVTGDPTYVPVGFSPPSTAE